MLVVATCGILDPAVKHLHPTSIHSRNIIITNVSQVFRTYPAAPCTHDADSFATQILVAQYWVETWRWMEVDGGDIMEGCVHSM